MSQLTKPTSYLQLYWLLQTGRVAILAVHRLLTYNRPCLASAEDPDRKRGWFEFRKQSVHNPQFHRQGSHASWKVLNFPHGLFRGERRSHC